MKGKAIPRDVTLRITGRAIGRRFEVEVNGRSVPLRGVGFLYLLQLAQHAALGNGPVGRGHRSGVNDARYIYRLKEELTEAGVGDLLPICSKPGYGYLLGLSPEQISFDRGILQDFPDYRVKEMLVEKGSGPQVERQSSRLAVR